MALLVGMIIPVPGKLRLTIGSIRKLGTLIADLAGQVFAPPHQSVIFDCRYSTSRDYIRSAYQFGLSDAGMYKLACQLPLSRYVGLIEISNTSAPLFDVLLDTTETDANPSILAFLRREGYPKNSHPIDRFTKRFGGESVS
jgi:hypothetical protein